MKPEPNSFLLRELRTWAGQSMREAAAMVHYSRPTWSAYETKGNNSIRMPLPVYELYLRKVKEAKGTLPGVYQDHLNRLSIPDRQAVDVFSE